MNESTNPAETGESPDFAAFQEKVKGTNINEQTLLATDYLNHFNEIVMLLEMIPDMPDMLEHAKSWQPKTYTEHFRDSTVHDRELAIEAYAHVPARYRQPFEVTTHILNRLIAVTLERADEAVAADDTELLRVVIADGSQAIRRLMDLASATIHGSEEVLDQAEIDSLLGP